MKIVIVGGVAGGASAAARLRRLDEKAEIIMLERGSYISYANCGLPYYVGGEITQRSALVLQTPESFATRFHIDVRVRHEALSIDRVRKQVQVRDIDGGRIYEETYDKLLLSPGAAPLHPNIPGIRDEGIASRIFTLRTIPDTFRIREYIEEKRPRTALVVGGGYIGLEMAENLVSAGLQVTVAEAADHVIGPLDYDMATEVHRYLRAKGITLCLSNGVKAFRMGADGIEVELSHGSVQADMVLMSIGVRPESSLAKEAGLAVSSKGTIIVDETLRTSDPDIFAVGDAIQVRNFVTGDMGYFPLAGPANKQGRIAADNIAGLSKTYKGTQGSAILKLFDMTVATTGLNEQAAKQAAIAYDKLFLSPASHATYYPGTSALSMKVLFEQVTGRILGAQIIGFEGVDKRIDVLAAAIRSNATARDLAEWELSYAPPYSSAKDPVNMAGFAIENLLDGLVKQYHWHDVANLPTDGSITLLDTRTNAEYLSGHMPNAVHIPLDSLRQRLAELDPKKPVYVYCHSGLRSYLACRILTQNGFDCAHLSGGYRLYASVMEQTCAGCCPV